jgi:hypothetical protein
VLKGSKQGCLFEGTVLKGSKQGCLFEDTVLKGSLEASRVACLKIPCRHSPPQIKPSNFRKRVTKVIDEAK